MYKNIDDQSLDDAAKKVVEVVDKASSKMLEKASVDDIAALQSYTIRSLDQQGSALMDVEQYKMLNVKDDPIQSRQRHLDVMCFQHFSPLDSLVNSILEISMCQHQSTPSLGY